MTNQFFCSNKDRWKKVSETPAINGIDYLEISSTDQKTITIHFLHDLVESPVITPPLTEKNIFITGGVRVKNIVVVSAISAGNILTVFVDKAGDFSTYTLLVGRSSSDPGTPPEGFDQQLSSIDFSFKINCPSDFDCKTDSVCPPEKLDEPVIDYLAKDYSSFTRLMLDRLSIIAPGWRERNAADLQMALVEMLAYIGDHLSYYQDAVATEAYLNTARRRISLKRHARLLDYFVHDGCNARVWIQIQVSEALDNVPTPANAPTVFMVVDKDRQTGLTVTVKEADKLIKQNDPVVFESMHSITLFSAHNQIQFYTWCDSNCCLPKGSTTATLLNQASPVESVSSPYEPYLQLGAGDVLIFEEIVSPITLAEADADPAHRFAVRLKSVSADRDNLTGINILNIEWYSEDALPFSLRLNGLDSFGDEVEISVARGNIVLADQGVTKNNKQLYPAEFTDTPKYYPKLTDTNITNAAPFNYYTAKTQPASLGLTQDVRYAIASVHLVNRQETWEPQKDLLSSNKFATEFVVETENDGTAYLRFGDNISGKMPDTGFSPTAIYRTGNGSAGNVGAETVNTIVWQQEGIISVRNPLPAFGGTEPETMEQVRQYAPQAFRTQERAVTEADYIEKTKLHPEVQNAEAKFYWTGSWYTVYIIIDRIGGKDIDEDFKEEIIQYLDQYRMAGYDLEIIQPTFVSLDISLNVCVKPSYFQADIKRKLSEAFSNGQLPDGTNAFFHPDNFTFGQPVYLSSIYRTAMAIDGVASVEIRKFQRWAKNPNGEIVNGLIQPLELEILRLDNDPSLPENGQINFTMLNGL